MTTADYIASLLSPEQEKMDWKKIREEAGRVLNPGPWKHSGVPERNNTDGHYLECRCGCRYYAYSPDGYVNKLRAPVKDCPVPPEVPGPIEVIAERLLRLCQDTDSLRRTMTSMAGLPVAEPVWEYPQIALAACHWFVWATPAERTACCLAALREQSK